MKEIYETLKTVTDLIGDGAVVSVRFSRSMEALKIIVNWPDDKYFQYILTKEIIVGSKIDIAVLIARIAKREYQKGIL